MKKYIILGLVATALTSSSAFAVKEGGGGDIQCDAKIKGLAANLLEWINEKGPELGNPKLNLSSSLNPSRGKPYSYSEYEKQMTNLLNMPLDVSCVKPGDKGYPVSVSDSAKICATFVDSTGVHMTCDRGLFLGLTPDLQIEQNHHEFAINIPGLEPDNGPISTYKISIQLSASTGDVTERKLIVNQCGGACPPKITSFTYDEATNYFQNGTYDPESNPALTLNTNWILVGLAGSPDTNSPNYHVYDPAGIKDSNNNPEASLQICGVVGGAWTASLFNIPNLGDTGPLVLGGWGDGQNDFNNGFDFSYPLVTEVSSKYGTAVCRMISGTTDNLLCAIVDINDSRYSINHPSHYAYYLKR